MRRIILFIFFVLTIIDLYDCTLPGQEFNQLIRPTQMFLIIVWMLTQVSYIYWLIVLKNCFILGVLYSEVQTILKPTKKLFIWASRYVFVGVVICLLFEGIDNWKTYIISIQSGLILFLTSVQKCSETIFKQLYVGFAVVCLSQIFGMILLSDPRWFVEMLDRITYVFGHLIFVAGLANIKLSPIRTNFLDNRISN